MLAQAIKSTRPTAPSKISSATLESPTIACLSGSMRIEKPASVSGNCLASAAPIEFISASACSSETPGLSRPRRGKPRAPRRVMKLLKVGS
jgi:hypothetical protein